ncbi:MAG: HNH endonuclease [Pseudomonadota bacterium]
MAARRTPEPPHKRWYRTARWARKRWAQLTADRFTCRRCGRIEHDDAKLVADHITPHRGDAGLFWNGALQTLCQSCHSGAKQAEECRGYDDTIGADGWPVDPRHPANAGVLPSGGGGG